MNDFLNYIKGNEDGIKSRDAEELIINKLMVKDAKQSEKLDDIDQYDSESLFGGKLYRGNIYIFNYSAKFPTKYKYGKDEVYFTDTLPLFLMLGETASTMYGINLNFCNKGLKTLILNMIMNLDEDFYNGGAEKLAANKNLVMSTNVYKFLSDPSAPDTIKKFLDAMYKGVDYSVIFRNYAISGISNIRLVEPWQWKYIPFLSESTSIKGETLSAILKISGIDTIKI